MYASYSRELKVKETLDDLGVECFIPMRYEMVDHQGERRRELVPAIHSLIFIHDTQERITGLKMYHRDCVALQYMVRRPRLDTESTEILTVPDAQMQHFIRVATSYDDNIVYLDYSDFLHKEGKRVRVIDGNFTGVEGVIKRIKKNKIVVVLLDGVAAVAITHLPPRFLQLI